MNPSPSSDLPGISVVIPAMGRLALLARLLDSIETAAAGLAGVAVEVLIIWDGAPAPEALVADRERHGCIAVQAIFHAGDAAKKRNYGVQAAQHNLILFVDSDCTIHPQLLTTLVQRFSDPRVQAAAPPVDFEPPAGALAVANAAMPYAQAFGWGRIPEAQWWLPTATLAVRRAAFEQAGGFRAPTYGPLRGEDVDFGLRLTAALGRPAISTVPVCPSTHARETWRRPADAFRRAWWFGWSEGDLRPRHRGFQNRALPPLLALGCVVALAGGALSALQGGALAMPLLALAALLLAAWGALQGLRLRQARVPRGALPAGVALGAVFDLARALSLWASGSLTGGMWYHEHQPRGAWPDLARAGWAVLICGTGAGLVLLWCL